jgi:hypothetical protein
MAAYSPKEFAMDKHEEQLPSESCAGGEKPPTARELVAEFLPRLAEALEREGRKTFPVSQLVRGRKFTMNCKIPPASKADDDLPSKVAAMSKAARRVYIALRDARSKDGGAAEPIWQTDLFHWIRAASPKDYLSKRTVFRVVKELCECGEVRRDDDLGYFVVGQQLALPF